MFVSIPWLPGREGALASPCPASSSSSMLHQQPKNTSAACPVPHVPLALQAKGQGTALLCMAHPPPALVKLSPARGFGLALCRGMSLSSRYLVPKCQRELQVLSTYQHVQATLGPCRQGVGSRLGHWGGPGTRSMAAVIPSSCVCLHWCLSRPSSLMLLHLLRNP